MDETKVAVMNTSKELTEILLEAISGEGFKTCSEYTYEFKNQEESFDNFINDNKPSVIIYDIAIPYKENYELFKKLSSRPSAKNIAFILTTTNKDALEEIVGKTKTHEIIGKPFDIQEVIDSIISAQKLPNTSNNYLL